MHEVTQRLKTLLDSDAGIDRLAECALLMSKSLNPKVDVGAYLQQFDIWAQYLRTQCGEGEPDAAERIAILNHFLFEELGFAGDEDNFFDPKNSYLDTVIERRLGIPITLSAIYIELGRRIGVPLQGVSFPGHFLVMLSVGHGAVVLDPFSEGASLELSDLENLLDHADPSGQWERAPITDLLVPASLSEILIRMLRNLKGIYWKAQDLIAGIGVQNLLLVVDPQLATERRDRGILNQRLGHAQAALQDFADYLEIEPNALDGELIRSRIVELNKSAHRVH